MAAEHLVPFSPRLRNRSRSIRLYEHPRRMGAFLVPTTEVVGKLLRALYRAKILEFEPAPGLVYWHPRDIETWPTTLLTDCLRGDADIRTRQILKEDILNARVFNRITTVAAEKTWSGLVEGYPLKVRNEDRQFELRRSFEIELDQKLDEVVADALCPVLARYLKHMPHTGCDHAVSLEKVIGYLMGMLANDRDVHGRSSLDNIWLATIDAIIIRYRVWALDYATPRRASSR